MTSKMIRKVVKIDEEKCDGCGACIPGCAEGALQLVNGKARLVADVYCDGLGACIGECPRGAISIEEREAEAFDEAAVESRVEAADAELPCGCPGSAVAQFDREPPGQGPSAQALQRPSMLGHWPVQLALVPPGAPFFRGADVVLVADCVPFAYGDFHSDFLTDRAVLVACPKLDDFDAHLARLTEVLRKSGISSLTVVHMDVPCCSGLVEMARRAVRAAGGEMPLGEITIGNRGDLLEWREM